MIPNEVNEENSRNNFVQIRLGEFCEQKEIKIQTVNVEALVPKEVDEKNDEILQRYHQYLRQEYRKENTRKNYHRFVKHFLKWLYDTRGKNVDQIASDDTKDYKAFCTENYAVNGNVGRLNALNNFTIKLLERPELRVSAPRSMKTNKPVLNEEEIEQYKNAAETSLKNSSLSTNSMDYCDQANSTRLGSHCMTLKTRNSTLMTPKPETTVSSSHRT